MGDWTVTNEFELWDRAHDVMLIQTNTAASMAQIIRLTMEARPDKVDNLYLIVYNVSTRSGRRYPDEWDIHAEGAEELDEWASKYEV